MTSITTKYIGPGNVRGSRVKATSASGASITLEWNNALGVDANHNAAAIALCQKMNWTGPLYQGDAGKEGYVYVFALDFAKVEVPAVEFYAEGKRYDTISASSVEAACDLFRKHYPNVTGWTYKRLGGIS
jgi:hypothetical protein